jgi:P27 family predicted phage terminase small subunit
MPRGRKPKPAYLRLLEGNPRAKPIPPQIQPQRVMPDPPEYLSADAKEEWLRLTPELYRLKLLTVADLRPFSAYCQAYGRWVTAERAIARMAEKDLLTSGLMIKTLNGNAIQNPLVGTAHKAAYDMVRYADEFGLTPAARTRIAQGTFTQAVSKFDGLLGRDTA